MGAGGRSAGHGHPGRRLASARPRPGRAPPRAAPPGWRVEWVDGPLVDVSSSAVRDVLERGGSGRRIGARRGDALHSPPQSVRCRQMSALPAETTDLSPRPLAVRPSAPARSCGPSGGPSRPWRAGTRLRWSVISVAILGLFVRPHRGSLGRAPLSPGLDVHVQLPPAAATAAEAADAKLGQDTVVLGHDRALRCGRRLRDHQCTEQPPRPHVGRRD